jgi:hypothetical protein
MYVEPLMTHRMRHWHWQLTKTLNFSVAVTVYQVHKPAHDHHDELITVSSRSYGAPVASSERPMALVKAAFLIRITD